MPIKVRTLHDKFGAEIVGYNATLTISAADYAAIWEAFESYSVLLFRGPVITDNRQLALSEQFGAVQVAFKANQTGGSMFSRQSNINFETNEIFPPDHHRMTFIKPSFRY